MHAPLRFDLPALIDFFRTHCRPGHGNPLALLCAAQIVSDLPVEHLLTLRRALEGARLERALAQLIEQRICAYA